jgi:hypothetical protein
MATRSGQLSPQDLIPVDGFRRGAAPKIGLALLVFLKK